MPMSHPSSSALPSPETANPAESTLTRRDACRSLMLAAFSTPALTACGGSSAVDVDAASAQAVDALGAQDPAHAAATAAGRVVRPPVVAPSTDYAQYLTHDTPSCGPTREVWNSLYGLRWRRGPLGDWTDADGIANGTKPFVSAELTAARRYSLNVRPLLARWMAKGPAKGFYLRTRSTAFPFEWAGRSSVDTTRAPLLVVQTSLGVFRLSARANASWSTSSSVPRATDALFSTSPQSPAIVHFDLGPVRGELISASLELTCQGWQRVGILDVYEADPPTFVIPDTPQAPRRGLAAELGSWAALRQHPAVLAANDFTLGGPLTQGFTPDAPRILNPATGTTYAQGTVARGALASCDIPVHVVRARPDGSVDRVVNELYFQYYMYLEADFGSEITPIKGPGLDARFGYWTPLGYWQNVSGNGGSPGDGRKVWNVTKQRWEYRGNSMRMHWGARSVQASDYDGLFSLAFYRYHLDQVGPFPSGGNWEGILVRRERWYCIDLYIRMNSVVGPFDEAGNGEAVADGQLKAWVNGLPAYSEDGLRWRRHQELGVQGGWLNVYHGGTVPSPRSMRYRLDRVTAASQFIGPMA